MKVWPTTRSKQAPLGPLVLLAAAACGCLLATRGRAAELPANPAPAAPVLTNASQVLEQGVEGAQLNPRPARLRGVVTLVAWNFGETVFFLEDETGAVLVAIRELPAEFREGLRVEVTGTSAPGPFYAYLANAEVRMLGEAPMPTPRRSTRHQLSAGEDFGRWNAIDGVVRDVAIVQKDRLIIRVASQGHWFFAQIRIGTGFPLPVQWLDARVEVRGIPVTTLDAKKRPNGFELYLRSPDDVRVIEPGGTNLFARPMKTAESLRTPPEPAGMRWRVQGVVTHLSAQGWFALEDSTGPVRAELLDPFMGYEGDVGTESRRKTLKRQHPDTNDWQYFPRSLPPKLRAGDVVELVGSPLAGELFAPRLTSSEYRVIDHKAAPAPKEISVADALSGKYDGRLVRMTARLVDRQSFRRSGLNYQSLWVQADGALFEAALVSADQQAKLSAEKNSYLELTGLCAGIAGELQRVRSFRLHLADPADVRVLSGPQKFWTSAAVIRVLAGSGVLGLIAFGWIALLRRQVKRQTVQLRRALAQERELNEMKSDFVSLVSHEFRTPLEVIVSSADILDRYLDRLTPPERSQHLHSIQDSVQRMTGMMEDVLLLGRFEAGRLHCHPDDLHLGVWCRRLVDEMRSATGGCIELSFDIPEPMASADEKLLRHILTNLLSNAVKYSAAGTPVEFRVRREHTDAVFQIADRGRGIPPADQARLFEAFHRARNVGQVPGTGLGLVIVKRGVDLHGGSISFASEEGKGTTFTVRLPVFEEEGRPAKDS